MCPLVTKLTISLEYQDELSQFISRLLVTQDETIVFNLWPLLGGTDDFGRDFETPPFPYIYYFPYPKGPPLPSAEALSKLMICPSCLSKCEIDAKYCSVCGYRFFSDE
jgi:hypothetical protein